VAENFAVAVTPTMAALIDPADPADPIARQFVPDLAELVVRPEELADPIGDAAHRPVAGIVHRYPDRVLLTLTHACPVYCRFCFRREMVGPGGHKRLEGEALESAMAYIAATPAIWEVILTGGDPLAIAPARLAAMSCERLGRHAACARHPRSQPRARRRAGADRRGDDRGAEGLGQGGLCRRCTPIIRAS
jgi:lysine 2,3-aminomutase